VTRPTARVLALLEILQSGGTRTVTDLAARLEVDERTVRRYVAHLLDLDIPVCSVRGRHSGYRLSPGYRMPPLMLTDDEAVAVLLGLVISTRAGWIGTSTAAAESAAAKVRRVLPDALARQVAALVENTGFTMPARTGNAPETGVLLRVADAVRSRRVVSIDYADGQGRRTERDVRPYSIVAHAGRWYLTGADSRSGNVRTFRLDRIASLRLGADTFELPDAFDPVDRLLTGLADAPHRHEIALRVHGPSATVHERFPAGLVTVCEDDEHPGWAHVTMRAERLDWVPGLLAGLGLEFVVERPDELRAGVRALARSLLAAAGEPP